MLVRHNQRKLRVCLHALKMLEVEGREKDGDNWQTKKKRN